MPRAANLVLLASAVVGLLTGCHHAAQPAAPAPMVDSPSVSPADPTFQREALAAVARLYGVVRWFHPSDEAAGADWDAVAVAATTIALESRTPAELRDRLDALYHPLAPALQLWIDGTPAPAPLIPGGEGPVLAWQHLGWSFGGDQPIYRAGRVGRPGMAVAVNGEITATNGEPARHLRGRRIRVSARMRAEGEGYLWLRIDHGEADTTADRKGWDEPEVTDPEWRRYEVTADLPDDATWFVFGARLTGKGTLWADDFRAEVLEPDGSWRALPVRDGGFADPERWWVFDGVGYDADVVEDHGEPVLRLMHQELLRGALFPAVPRLGEAFERAIGAGLVARVPITLPDGPERAPVAVPAVAPDRDDPAVRVAAALVAWNVLRHFHPYEEDLHVDWDAVLVRTIDRALAAPDRAALVDALWALQVEVPDGHAYVGHRAVTGRRCGLAVRWVRVGDELVVTNSGDPRVKAGDRVVSVDGASTAAALARAQDRVSGSPQFRAAFAAERLGMAACGSETALEVERDGKLRRVTVAHAGGAPPLFDHPGVEAGPGGILLVDLNATPWEQLDVDALARAPGVVFDLREYPTPGALHVIEHLLTHRDTARGWMRVPHIVRPGEVAGWERHEWGLLPARPHVGGKVVFLTSSLAISAAESILALVKGEGLATLIGERTAGTNGNATGAILPGGYWIQFTGMRVVQPDGSPFHLVGVEPDVVVAPTVEGIRAGRDEVRDAAIGWLGAAVGR